MNPWLEDDAGYKYVAPFDDGSWGMMMQPGASGHGLVVMSVEPHSDGQYVNQVYDPKGIWLVPAVVTWYSVIGEDGRLAPWAEMDIRNIVRERGAMAGPPVAIMGASAWTAGDWWEDYKVSTQLANVSYRHWDIEEMDLFKKPDQCTGYLSVLQVKPITERAFKDIGADIIAANELLALPALSIGMGELDFWNEEFLNDINEDGQQYDEKGRPCHCPIVLEEIEDEIDCTSQRCLGVDVAHTHPVVRDQARLRCDLFGRCPCAWDFANGQCACGSDQPVLKQQRDIVYELVHSGLVTVKNDIIRPAYHDLWDFCVDRYQESLELYANSLAAGLSQVEYRHAEELTEEERKTQWFISSWRRQSPYWAMHTLAEHRQRLSLPSTDSVRSLAS